MAWSKLEIDERPALRRAEAEVEDHEHRHADTHAARFKEFLEARLKRELIHPYQADQQNHEGGHLWRVPGSAEDARDDEQSVVEGTGAEENPGEANESEGRQLFGQVRNALTIERRTLQSARDENAERMQHSPNDECPRRAVPDA